jgi:hypothetical protein
LTLFEKQNYKNAIQFFKYLNLDFWQRQQLKNKYCASILIPLFNSVFFKRFVKRVIALTRDKALVHGSGWEVGG